MPVAEQLYLAGVFAAFFTFGIALAYCRLTSASRPR